MRNWTKENHSSLVWEICKSPGIAAFDFDNTLIKNDFGETVMNSLILDGLSELQTTFSDYFRDKTKASRVWKLREKNPSLLKQFVWEEYSYLMQTVGVEKAYRWSSFLFSGWRSSKIRSYSKKVWKSELKRKEDSGAVKPYKEMVGLVKFLKENNWTVFIVTASPEQIIQEVCTSFFVPKENVIGMKLLEKEGVSSSEIIEPYTYGQGKVDAFFARTSLYPDLAFGDSENDFPLLKAAKRFGVLIDRGNSELADKCKNIGCLIQPVFK